MEIEKLLSASSSREFLRLALWMTCREKGKVNYADFSRKCGFSSRSFIVEFLSGKKQLSVDSLRRIKMALKLPKDYLKYFEFLVFKENPVIRPSNLKIPLIDIKLVELKKQIYQVAQYENKQSLDWLTQPETFLIYASLGSICRGASTEEIYLRTKIPMEKINEILAVMIRHKLISVKKSRYYVYSETLDILNFKDAQTMKILTENFFQGLRKNFIKTFNNPNSTILFTTFSIQPSQIKNFKRELNEHIFQLIDKYQDDDGTTVQQVFFSPDLSLHQAQSISGFFLEYTAFTWEPLMELGRRLQLIF